MINLRMRGVTLMSVVILLLFSAVTTEAQFSHRLLVRAGDLAPLPPPPVELTDDFWDNFPSGFFNEKQTFEAFDEDRHYVNDEGLVVFRARLKSGLWGYWLAGEGDILPLFLEGFPPPYNFEPDTTFMTWFGDFLIYQRPANFDDLPRFLKFFAYDPLRQGKQLIPPSLAGRPDVQDIGFFQFGNYSMIATTSSQVGGDLHQEIRVHLLDDLLGENDEVVLERRGEVFSYNGIPYRNTLLMDVALSRSHAVWFAHVAATDPKPDQTYPGYMIRRSSGWKDTAMAAGYLAIGTLSVGNNGTVAFKGKVDDAVGPWGIHVIDEVTGSKRLIAEEGPETPDAKAKRFDMLPFFQISDKGLVTLMGREPSTRRWGVWSELRFSENNYELFPLAVEGMVSPHDDNLIIDQILRAVANDRGEVCFISTQKDKTGRFAGTTYWFAYFDPETGESVHEPIVTEFEPELTLPSGDVVRGSDIDSLGTNLRHNSPHGRARSFSNNRQTSFHVQYLHPTTFEPVDSLWLSSPSTFVVNHPGDEPDAAPGDGIADARDVTSVGKPIVTLRAALMEANALGGRHRIQFKFDSEHVVEGVATIQPGSPLPDIHVPIQLDASSQAGPDESAAGVVLDGSKVNVPADGLVFHAGENDIKGITIRNFSQNGITSHNGTLRLADVDLEDNGGAGVEANSLTIRASSKRQSTLIQRNGAHGILVHGALDADACHIQNNGAEGILSFGDQLVMNRSDRTLVYIKDNGAAGIEAESARNIEGGRLAITGNGNQQSGDGAGINAPQAHVALFDSEIKSNASTGLRAKSVELFGGQTVIEANGLHGIHVAGNLETEVVRLSRNQGWAVLSEGDQILINEEDDGTCFIDDNELGGISFSGTDLFLVKTDIYRNGAKSSILEPEGYGIYAPQAAVVLDDVKVFENQWTGVSAKDLTVWGNLGEMRQNGNNGAFVTGNFYAEDRCVLDNNQGWGIEIEGQTCEIGDAVNPQSSSIQGNGLGGIRFLGGTFNGVALNIHHNGSPERPAIGLEARQASVNLDGVSVVGHHDHGLIAKKLALGNSPAEFNQNGKTGAWVLEELTANNGITVSGNGDWGMIIEGPSAEIGLKPNPSKSSVKGNAFGGIRFLGSTFRAWELDILGNGSPDHPGSGLEAKNAHVFLGRASSKDNKGHGIWSKDLTLLEGLTEFSDNSENGAMVLGKFASSDKYLFSGNGAWGITVEGESAQFGDHPLGTRSIIEKNGYGGILFGGTELNARSMDVRENGATHPFGAGVGIAASLAAIQLQDASVSDNHGVGIHAASANIKQADIDSQTHHGLLVCPGPALLQRVHLIGNQMSGLVVCDANGGDQSILQELEVRNNLVDGIRNESLSPMDITLTLFDGNGRFGVNNTASMINVHAIGNNWGHPTGPSGVGPGQGDAVSKNVLYQEPEDTSPLEIVVPENPTLIEAGSVGIIPVSIRHGERNEDITLRANDSLGWLQLDGSGLIMLELLNGATETQLSFQPSADASPGSVSEVVLDATVVSGALLGKTSQATFLIQVASNPDPEPPSQPEILPDPQSGVAGYRGQHDTVLYFEITGDLGGSIWGTGVYTDDSTLGTAAVHAGILEVGETAIVKVTILPGQESYESTEQNSVVSQSYGAWTGSYRIEASDLNQNVEHPNILIERQADLLILSWTSEDNTLQLESTSNLGGSPDWTAETNVDRDGKVNRFEISPREATRFFRIRN